MKKSKKINFFGHSNKSWNKKAQLQMTENIVIIIVIVFILMFGFIFYAKVRAQTLEDKSKEYSELDLVQASQAIVALPELSCSSEALVEIGCLNKLKLEAFDVLNMKVEYFEYYRKVFGKSRVTIISVFPSDEFDFELYNNPYNGSKSGSPMFIPINIFDPINNKWVAENEGVAPDIEVHQDAVSLAKGIDPQLERAVKEALLLLEKQGEIKVNIPPFSTPAIQKN